ncbi:MAG: type II toxin-antitoxin system RelE/ParE family toxin [Planctomycetes bacterium]|nr:type II toxin-antitoxin system RelE/ParE family toxin [Planctomycetota bacterium]
MFSLCYRRLVKRDIIESYRWYETQQKGLGADWVHCLEEVLSRIARNPEMFGRIRRQIRCAMFHRFPYNVYFRVDGDSVLIFGVFHASRDPRHWQSRV